jgi:hypothetical protein
MCFDAKLYLEKDKCNAWVINLFLGIYINMFPTFVTILPLTIPANYRLPSQFLSVGLKVGVRVWLMQKYLFHVFSYHL